MPQVRIYSLLKSNLGVPKVPALTITRPVPGVNRTVPVYPPSAEQATSTPVARPPSRTMRLTAVSVHSVNTLDRATAVARYVARGPPRSPWLYMNVEWPKVRFFSPGLSLGTTYAHPDALRPPARAL